MLCLEVVKKLPFIPGMYPGAGLSPYTGHIYSTPFLNFNLWSPSEASGQYIDLSLHTITSKSDLINRLNICFSLPPLVESPDCLELIARLIHQQSFCSQKLYALLTLMVTTTAEVAREFEFNPAAKQLFDNNCLDEFYATYGHGFIAGQVKGGYCLALIEVEAQGSEDKLALSSSINRESISIPSIGIEAVRSLSNIIANRETHITVAQTGGQMIPTSIGLGEMLEVAAAFPSQVMASPVIPTVLYMDYMDTPQFRRRDSEFRSAHAKFTRYMEQLESIHKNYSNYMAALLFIRDSKDLSAILPNTSSEPELLQTIQKDIIEIESQLITLQTVMLNCQGRGLADEDPYNKYEIAEQSRKALLELSASESWNVFRNMDHVSCANTTSSNAMSEVSMNKNYYNVAIVGLTGVGKSALVNYLFGDQVAKTGIGKPVTQRGFTSWTTLIGNLPVRLFDSWGLEVKKLQEWTSLLEHELETRGTSRPVRDWFHTILYCINAGSSRIQDADIDVIDTFRKRKYNVIVVLTKSDTISEDDCAEFTSQIIKSTTTEVSVVPICSCRRVLRGTTIDTFGKRELERAISYNFWKSILLRVPERCRKLLEAQIEKWEADSIASLNRMQSSGVLPAEAVKQLSLPPSRRDISKFVQDEIAEALSLYGNIEDQFLTSTLSRFDKLMNSKGDSFTVSSPGEFAEGLNVSGALAFLGGGGAGLASLVGVALGVTTLGTFIVPAFLISAAGLAVSSSMDKKSYRQAIESVREYAQKSRSNLQQIEGIIHDSLAEYRG